MNFREGFPSKFQLELVLHKMHLNFGDPFGKICITVSVGNDKKSIIKYPAAKKETIISEIITFNPTLYECSVNKFHDSLAHVEVLLLKRENQRFVGDFNINLADLAKNVNQSRFEETKILDLNNSSHYNGKLDLTIKLFYQTKKQNRSSSHTAFESKEDVKENFINPTRFRNESPKRAIFNSNENPLEINIPVEIAENGRPSCYSEKKNRSSDPRIPIMELENYHFHDNNILKEKKEQFVQTEEEEINKEKMHRFNENNNNILKEKIETFMQTEQEEILNFNKNLNEKIESFMQTDEECPKNFQEGINEEIKKKNEIYEQLLLEKENIINDNMKRMELAEQLLFEKENKIKAIEEDLVKNQHNEIILMEKIKAIENNLKEERENREHKILDLTEENSKISKIFDQEKLSYLKKHSSLMEDLDAQRKKETSYQKNIRNLENSLEEMKATLSTLQKKYIDECRDKVMEEKQIENKRNEMKNLESYNENLKKQMVNKEKKLNEVEEINSILQEEFLKCKQKLADVINLLFEKGGTDLMESVEALLELDSSSDPKSSTQINKI